MREICFWQQGGVKNRFPKQRRRPWRSMKRAVRLELRRRRRQAAWVRRAAAAARARRKAGPETPREPARSPGALSAAASSGRGCEQAGGPRSPEPSPPPPLAAVRALAASSQGDGGGGGGVWQTTSGTRLGRVACCGLRDGLWRWVGDHCGRGP